MSITLKPEGRERLSVTGDITSTLRIPVAGLEDRFWITASDGTRILASPDDRGDYGFRLFDEGAGIVRIGQGEAVVEWTVEWVSVAGYYEAAARPPLEPHPLPLFDRLAA